MNLGGNTESSSLACEVVSGWAKVGYRSCIGAVFDDYFCICQCCMLFKCLSKSTVDSFSQVYWLKIDYLKTAQAAQASA